MHHRRKIAAMQERFENQLETLKQQQNNSTLEMKFDKLLEMLTLDIAHTMQEESLQRKKGQPNNQESTVPFQTNTPTQSNKNNSETVTRNMDIDDKAKLPMNLQFDHIPTSPQRNTNTTELYPNNSGM